MNNEELILSDSIKYCIMKNAKRFNNIEKKDLFQAGYIGAIKASKRYDAKSNVEFYTFANKYIFGEMYVLAMKNMNIKLNKNYLKINKQLNTAYSLLSQKFNRIPSIKELSLFLSIDERLVSKILELRERPVSLDEEFDQLNGSTLHNTIGTELELDTKILINDSLKNLDNLEKKIIYYRYYKDYTQQEIAHKLGLSQVKISRLEKKSKQKIKQYICA